MGHYFFTGRIYNLVSFIIIGKYSTTMMFLRVLKRPQCGYNLRFSKFACGGMVIAPCLPRLILSTGKQQLMHVSPRSLAALYINGEPTIY